MYRHLLSIGQNLKIYNNYIPILIFEDRGISNEMLKWEEFLDK